MKKLLTLISFLSLFFIETNAQSATPEIMQITTVESVVGGGMGRSKMVITKSDGSQEEKDLANLFSMAGINFKNIRENEATITETLKSYMKEGWKLKSTTPLSVSPSGNGMGIFMTRYILEK